MKYLYIFDNPNMETDLIKNGKIVKYKTTAIIASSLEEATSLADSGYVFVKLQNLSDNWHTC